MSAEKYRIGFLFLLWIFVHVALFYCFGIRTLYDSKGYIQGADYLLANNTLEDVHHIFYAVPIVILSFFRLTFTDSVLPFLLFQIVVSGIAMIALYKTTAKVFKNSYAGFFATLVFLLWWDNIQWNTTILTESLFCSVTILIFYFTVCFDKSKLHIYLLAVLVIILFFIRPTAVVIYVGIISYVMAKHWNSLQSTILRTSFFLILVTVVCCAAYLLLSRWDFTEQYAVGNIVTYMNEIEGTALYHESLRLSTDQLVMPEQNNHPAFKIISFIYLNPLHFFEAFCWKIGYLISGVRPYYSMGHNVFTILWLIIIYFGFFVGARISKPKSVNILVFSIVIANCLLVGISTVDWDNRFYIPMEPVIALTAGGGLARVYAIS